MAESAYQRISFVIPVYNESAGLEAFHSSLLHVLEKASIDTYEIIYCDDGSTDTSLKELQAIAKHDSHVRVIALSRNFGKEIALTAGISEARGKAILTLDADGQHPVELIPKFIERWRAGSKVIIGIRTSNDHEGPVKHYGDKLFYSVFNRFSKIKFVPGLTDYCLIDQALQRDFLRMTEHNRIMRGLVEWLGYPKEYIEFAAKPRASGNPSYSVPKLTQLAIDSIISHSLVPLYITAYVGAIVLPFSTILGLVMLVNYLSGDPLGFHATASSYGVVLLLFLVGIMLVSQGIVGLYISHIHTETKNRPLYIINEAESVRLHEH